MKDIRLRIQIDYCPCSISLLFHGTRRSIGAPNKFTTSSQLKRYWHWLKYLTIATSSMYSIDHSIGVHPSPYCISFDPCALTDEYWSMHTGQCALINVHLLLSSDWCTDQILFWSIHCSIIVQVQYIGQGTLASHQRLLPFPDIALPLPRSMPRLGRNCFAAQIIQEQ